MNEYLQAVEKAGQNPNFWMSEEYIQKANLVWVYENELLGYKMNPKDDEWFFPPIDKDRQFDLKRNIFCGFVLSDSDCEEGSFLDFQFFYNPPAFLSMQGSHWDVFRKNIRKIPKRTKGELIYKPICGKSYSQEISQLIIEWSDRMGEVQDHIVCIKYALSGCNRWGLFLENQLIGLNVWDENFKYINFRYCIDNGMPFLQEYLRYRFYLRIMHIQKWVNDGGVLDNAGLKRFKEKLNPITIGKVCQYKGKDMIYASST